MNYIVSLIAIPLILHGEMNSKMHLWLVKFSKSIKMKLPYNRAQCSYNTPEANK